jgi:hypothetical protein
MRPWRSEPFDIERWRRRHPMGQPHPRARHETTLPMTGRQRSLALRQERRLELAKVAERDADKERERDRLDRWRRREWEAARDRLWDERRAAAPPVERDC